MTKLVPIHMMMVLVMMARASLGQNLHFPAGSRSAAVAHASVALSDPWSILNNQAGMASMRFLACGVYAENRYLLKELGYQAGFILLPARPGILGLSFSRFGFQAFNENRMGLAFARSFGHRFSIGIQMKYAIILPAELVGRNNYVSFEAGMNYHITPDLVLGMHLSDPLVLFVKDKTGVDFQMTRIRMGLSYFISGRVTLVVEGNKNLDDPMSIRAGMEYSLSRSVCFRSGLMTNPVQVTFGTGYVLGRIVIDFSAAIHQQLGWYPQLSVHFVQNRKIGPSDE